MLREVSSVGITDGDAVRVVHSSDENQSLQLISNKDLSRYVNARERRLVLESNLDSDLEH